MPTAHCSDCGCELFPDEIELAEIKRDGLCPTCREKNRKEEEKKKEEK